jgi:hypothetical protein
MTDSFKWSDVLFCVSGSALLLVELALVSRTMIPSSLTNHDSSCSIVPVGFASDDLAVYPLSGYLHCRDDFSKNLAHSRKPKNPVHKKMCTPSTRHQ